MRYYGRFQVPETPSSLVRLHFTAAKPTDLKPQDWEPLMGVLDQSDLLAQGIQCSSFIPGAQDVDALGSCTANATTSALSNKLPQNLFFSTTGVTSYSDVVGGEKFAIKFYHQCTDQTGDPSQEWPPTDCGSSGPYIVDECISMGLATGDQIAVGAMNILSLMQADGLLLGSPWFYAWEEPDSNGFIDSTGLQAAIASGVAGGHETYWSAIESIGRTPTGDIDPTKTIMRGRNSWSKSWGDNGSYRCHLSTFLALANHCDFRQLTV